MSLSAIVSFSVRHAGVVASLGLVLMGYGLFSLGKAQYDVFPEFAPPQVTIQTEAPGLSPEQVETLVTQPVENAANGVSGIATLRSSSIQGLSVIILTFDPKEDIYRARQMVSERLATLGTQLPQGVKPPVMTPLTSSTSVILVIGLTSDSKSLMALRDVADWSLKQRLLAVPGIAKVSVFGGDVRQLQIQLRPDQLTHYGLSMDDVLAAARRSTDIQGSGFIETANQRIVLKTNANANDAEAIAKSRLIHGSNEAVDLDIALKDVADVADGAEPRVGAASVMGREGVVLMVSSQFGANTRDVTRRVEAALSELKPALDAQGITLHPDLFRPANFIETVINNIRSDLLLGAALVIAVLFLFLFHARSALISASAIPLSLIAGAVMLNYAGFTLNTMTLGGLAMAIGAVVDDAVIDVENILRRLRENEEKQLGKSRLRVIFEASVEVRSAIVFATFAVVLVFLPILGLSGLAGRLFAPLGLAYISAILASLVVALTITPALCILLLRERDGRSHETRLARGFKAAYVHLLARISRAPRGMLVVVGALFLGSLAALPLLENRFIPELREGHFIVHMSAIPGTSLTESLRIGQNVTDALLKLPFIRAVSQRVGRAEAADDVWGSHYSEFEVDQKPLEGEEAEQAQFKIRQVLAQFPGVNFAMKPFLTERVEETLSGYTAGGVLNIYGADLDVLDRAAGQVLRVLGRIPGAANIQLQSPLGTPELSITLKPEALAYWGLEPVDVLSAIRMAYDGETVSHVYRGNQVVDVAVLLAPGARKSVTQVGDLPIKAPSGSIVKLSTLAEIAMTSGRYVVLRDGARRVQTITFDVGGGEISAFINQAREKIAEQVALPSGTYISFAGTAEAERQARQDLLVFSALAAFGIIALLAIVTGSRNNLILVLLNLPFSLAGGVLTILMMGGMLTLGALVGLVTLFGISLRNSVMMIAHFEHLVHDEGQPWSFATMLRGASERLLPVLMTAIVTALGLLPLALGSGNPGREIEGPMAIVILGGLVSSTLLNLVVLPGLAWRYAKFQGQEANGQL